MKRNIYETFDWNGREIRDRVVGVWRHRVGAAFVCGALAVALSAAPARAANDLAQEGGTGALAALATLVYGPVKIVYAAGGLLFGGLAYGLSGGDAKVLHSVLTPAIRGDYIVTPDVLRGNDTLRFLGRDPRYNDEDFVAVEDVY